MYLVDHPRLPRKDAIKVLLASTAEDPSFRERFNLEADRAAALWHPHIVGVRDRGEHTGHLWIAMEYVDGRQKYADAIVQGLTAALAAQ
ncbi:hypothetical protein B7435_30015 [Mycolicibacterium peregrinum]|uniref:Protein kinase domain-containing protein n=1 Tax=Mycolicibacterium alvei TaxID=67081 RepID=A0A6N4V303_9MYCO|nr:hypothetical protein [Mycolicibacterium alvei]OWL95525.1 hypothetical protein B7435_30015 [Mycolicibacterium peregrinum]BBX30493.1 hypothetical protein MALV_56180 [Mycolicibacterium alvei]